MLQLKYMHHKSQLKILGSTPKVQQNLASSPSSSPSPYPTLASLMPRKTRSLREIYDVDTINSFSVFALFSQIDAA